MPAKTTTGGTSTRYANTLAGEPIAQRTGSTTRFFLKDLHGDTVGLVNTLAQDRMSVAFDPWGELLGQTGTESTWFGFQSDPTDPDTGQVDMGTRWYEGGLGRFITRDSLFGDLNDPESLNQFGYGQGAPVTYFDPTGMFSRAVSNPGGIPGTAEDNDSGAPSARQIARHRGGWGPGSAANTTALSPAEKARIKKYIDTSAMEEDKGCGVLWLHCAAHVVSHAVTSVAQSLYDARWQLMGALVTGICLAATAGIGSFGCLGAALIVAGAKELEVLDREIEAPGPFNWGRVAKNTGFNAATTGLGLFGGVGMAFTGACSGSRWCSDPYVDDPLDPNDDPGVFS